MVKKKRYIQNEVKTVEVYRKPTLQEAWDVVSEHIEVVAKQGISCMFIDYCGAGEGHFGFPNINYVKGEEIKIWIESSKPFKSGW